MLFRRLSAVVALAFASAAAFASPPQYTTTDLTPPNYLEAFFFGAGGTQAAGWGDFSLNDPNNPDLRDVHAFVWNQDTHTMVDLDPGGDTSATYASGAFGGYQVGRIFTSLNGNPA